MFRQTMFRLAILATTAIPQFAMAEPMIAPTRVVLENGERAAELVLVNKGDEEGAYRINIENRRMLPNGALESAEETLDGELFADTFLRFSPRRVLLEPGARQTIRISAQTAGLSPGEYRSHLRIMGAPTSAGRTLEGASDAAGDNISIELVAIRSLTVPIIVRVGDLDSEVEIDSSAVVTTESDSETMLVVHLTRSGNRSTYGDLEIYTEAQEEPVYFARGIAIYTPNAERDVFLPMPADLAESLKGQSVRIAYVSSDPGQPGTIAETTALVN